MIDPKELRVGNYVDIHSDAFDAEYWIVDAIPSIYKVFLVEPGHEQIMVEFLKAKLNPIPITYEWLKGLGFAINEQPEEFSFDEWIFQKDACWGAPIYFGDYNGKGYVIDGLENKPIKYVHQLQNLHFALTGEELELKK